MRLAWPLVKGRLVAAAVALAVAMLAPAFARQSAIDLDLSPSLPPRADTGKPAIVLPSVTGRSEAGGCLPQLPCGTRLLGTVRRNGAVEVQVPALRW